MAIIIAANWQKKVPIIGTDYSSQQASITITAEVGDLNQVATEAQRLYALAEQAVDAQLRIALPQPASAANTAQSPTPRPAPNPQTRQASQPYRPSTQRRGPAPVTDSQLRFLTRLIDQTKASLPAILEHHQVGGLDQLSCKDAAGLIDELKTRVPA